MKYEDFVYKKTNREKSMSPKSGEHWCDSCDSAKVATGKKCPVCKNIQGGGKRTVLKKEPLT